MRDLLREFFERSESWRVATLLFVVVFASRVPFMSRQIFHTDSHGLALGALFTWTAHPPGFIGFCALGRIVNYVIDDINLSFVLMNVVATAGASAMTFLLGESMFDRKTGLLGSTLFATSLCSYYFSEVALTYAAEGFFATLTAWTGWKALRGRSLPWTVACTLALGLGGSVRQTTLAFLFPLWVWVVWRSSTTWRRRFGMAALLALVVTAWMIPNTANIRRYWEHDEKGYLQSFYDLQVRMKQYYDPGDMGSIEYTDPEPRYHWPFVEMVVASWNVFHPPSEDAPPEIRSASWRTAARATAVQTAKLLFYLVLAVGLALPFFLRAAVRLVGGASKELGLFFGFWILPATAFFSVGHFGSWGYLLIFLAGLSILAARGIVEFGYNRAWSSKLVAAVVAGASVAFFVFGAPLEDESPRKKLAT